MKTFEQRLDYCKELEEKLESITKDTPIKCSIKYWVWGYGKQEINVRCETRKKTFFPLWDGAIQDNKVIDDIFENEEVNPATVVLSFLKQCLDGTEKQLERNIKDIEDLQLEIKSLNKGFDEAIKDVKIKSGN